MSFFQDCENEKKRYVGTRHNYQLARIFITPHLKSFPSRTVLERSCLRNTQAHGDLLCSGSPKRVFTTAGDTLLRLFLRYRGRTP